MTYRQTIRLCVGLGVVVAGCVDNTAPGNDREADLDRPSSPAALVDASEALSGVATALLMPEIMTEADQSTLPRIAEACRFRMTEVGFPVLVYGSSAVVKLNGKLVPLSRQGDGRFVSAGVEVDVRRLEGDSDGPAPVPAELVLRLPGAPNELGFHGFSTC